MTQEKYRPPCLRPRGKKFNKGHNTSCTWNLLLDKDWCCLGSSGVSWCNESYWLNLINISVSLCPHKLKSRCWIANSSRATEQINAAGLVCVCVCVVTNTLFISLFQRRIQWERHWDKKINGPGEWGLAEMSVTSFFYVYNTHTHTHTTCFFVVLKGNAGQQSRQSKIWWQEVRFTFKLLPQLWR